MSVKRYPFGCMPNGDPVYRYELRSGVLSVSVLTYGATIQSIVFDGKDVVLGTTIWSIISAAPAALAPPSAV